MIKNTDIKLFPAALNGEIAAPPSKSLSHRALICAGLSKGRSVISNIIYSEDIIATINALELLGVSFEKRENSIIVDGVKKIKSIHKPVNCNESGSTLRFMIPILSLSDKEVIFTGSKSLINRPQTIYEKIYKEDGNIFRKTDENILVNGSIKPREYHLKGNVSSQFFSGLMFSLPLLEGDSTIYIEGNLESKSYIDLTIDILKRFGIEIDEIENGYFIEGNQIYHPHNYTVEGDYSQAAFYLVAGVISGLVRVSGLTHDSKQGDIAIIDQIKQMSGKVIYMENGYITESSKTKSAIIDLSNCPDLGPIITLLASLSHGTTSIINISRLRIKESDRVLSTVETLKALGANIRSTKDKIIVVGKSLLEGGVNVDSYNDHRIAMMVSIAALKCKKEIILTNANAVNKSYPGFFEDYLSLGGKYKKL